MPRVTLEEAHARLPELLAALAPGEELEITQDDWPVAKLIRQPPRLTEPRKFGTLKDSILYMADDFDAPLDLTEAKE